MKTKKLETDVLIIGGGTAGCFAAYTLGKEAGISVLIAEKANIKRSGCLAAGVNALNAYITEGHVRSGLCGLCEKGCTWNCQRGLAFIYVRATESCNESSR